ncbi:glycine betaine ABC transporter substrate-binding protein [Evansella halocellulosilytica]|uniref:glycine betaine ABC transporter substrate-binding protein n=1 Tax=Evansella halocellulosilytica TaxID=2011013 RepID=UPI000BB8097C|nr:glycine betaine ABC transporter substrate-binding protein [Evansella halocellulosilytica]
MKKSLLTLSSLALLLAACGDAEGGTNNSEEVKGTISFGVTPWTSTVPPTEVAKLLIEDLGYEVEETQADVSSVFMGLSRGDIDVFMDSWMPVHEVYFDEYSDTVVDTAISYDNADAGLTVPTYLEDINNLEDLFGNEDMFENEIYGIEEGASATSLIREFIEEEGADMDLVASSEGGMIAQAQRQMNNEEPVIFYGWRPHTMFNEFDIKILEDDFGYFEQASVHVVTNHELEEHAPEVFEFLENWSISIDDVEEMIQKIEDGEDEQAVAQEWIDNNQDRVDEMLGN